MKRKTKIFTVKTYTATIKNELGGEGLYYAFGYESEWTSYRIFLFNPETYAYKILMKDDASKQLEYYEDTPMDEKQEAKIIKNLKEKTGYDIK